MGSVREKDLWRLLEPKKVGSLEPVGAASAMGRPTATAIRKKDDGFWYYKTEEVPLEFWPNRFLEVPFDGGQVIWMGLEVKTKDFEWKRKHLSFALKPYSLNWYGSSAFRPAAKRKADVQRALKKKYEKTGDLRAALQDLSYDPFETNRDYLTARLSAPTRLHWDGVKPLGEQFSFGRSVNYSFGSKGKENAPQWMFGVCDEYELARADLKTEILADIKLSRKLPMEPAAIFDASLEAAIRQALAGREGGSADNRIVYDVFRIFKGHMEAAAKRSGAAPR